MELADGVRLEPGYAIPEESVEDIQPLLRHCPGVADINL